MTINEFKEKISESTTKVVLLGMATFGIYYFIWLAERRKPMNELGNKEIYDKNWLIFAAVFGGLSAMLTSFNIMITGIFVFIFDIAYSILMIMIAWKIGCWLETFSARQWQIDLKANRFLLVIFNIFYVNYLINKIIELAEKRNTF